MSNLTIVPQWHDTINQVEKDDFITGGADGNANLATRQLAENIFWLKQYVMGLSTGTTPTPTTPIPITPTPTTGGTTQTTTLPAEGEIYPFTVDRNFRPSTATITGEYFKGYRAYGASGYTVDGMVGYPAYAYFLNSIDPSFFFIELYFDERVNSDAIFKLTMHNPRNTYEWILPITIVNGRGIVSASNLPSDATASDSAYRQQVKLQDTFALSPFNPTDPAIFKGASTVDMVIYTPTVELGKAKDIAYHKEVASSALREKFSFYSPVTAQHDTYSYLFSVAIDGVLSYDVTYCTKDYPAKLANSLNKTIVGKHIIDMPASLAKADKNKLKITKTYYLKGTDTKAFEWAIPNSAPANTPAFNVINNDSLIAIPFFNKPLVEGSTREYDVVYSISFTDKLFPVYELKCTEIFDNEIKVTTSPSNPSSGGSIFTPSIE